MRPANYRGKRGFTLLEVLVAIAIAGFGLFAMFELQQSLVSGQRRYAAALDRANIIRNATVLLRDVNPSDPDTGTEGTIDLPPNMTIDWTAEPVTEQQFNTVFPGTTQSSWYVQLWKITANVSSANGAVIQTVTLERVGYAQPSDAADDAQ